MARPHELITNRVLTALPAPEFARLAPMLEPVSLTAGEVVTTASESAQHVGLRRAGVTMLCQELVHAGAIGHSRGRVRLLDRRLLEQSACECYHAMAPTGGAETTVPDTYAF
ncbi:MAG TPA: hypothetical protein VE642_01885 [Pyrinomonadaceae bacterium]|jgi:hypothetical protein|nr:hypothetical protein [Pyrinomonadaceae bacterium]